MNIDLQNTIIALVLGSLGGIGWGIGLEGAVISFIVYILLLVFLYQQRGG